MYQKCPICNGSGISMTITSSNAVCPTCQGRRIISEINGLPPNYLPTTNYTQSNTTDFRDNVESQDEYYGKNKTK